MVDLQNFINGQFQAPLDGTYLENRNPATRESLGAVPDSKAEDIERAVTAAQAAFPAWSATSPEQRAGWLHKIANSIEANLEEFAALESQDQGKPISVARTVDIPRVVANFRFFAGAILHEASESHHRPGSINYTYRKPIGVAGLISPWNLPLYLLTWKIAPALATGNTAVCKPSEWTSLTAFRLSQIMADIDLPPGVCNLVFGTGPHAGAALTGHPDVPLISFTGGTATAQAIMSASAPHFKKLSLELGGKNPALIFDDADLDRHLPTLVRASFANQGEICLCNSRIYVQRALYAEFVERFVAAVRLLKVGDPSDPLTQIGALVSEPHWQKVRRYVALAKELGATVHCGGDVPELQPPFDRGFFLNPCVFTGLEDSCPVIQEEIFGPVVTISPFDNESEVIQRANNVRYGLAASVWTQDLSRAHRVAQALQSGIVWVNTWMNRDLRTPFGGMKASGMGREGGHYSLDFYSETQNICIEF
ncbi:MAG: aldehyde dehydrogenase [Acidobacteria bacterium]|nr:aldehyde dehydrogenase [Acidobacteriota bacterium]MCB9399508.1 aldehyde dehydrogenase [Acidobacteriota bacterium]